jgi:hypothetical protein
LSSAYGDLSTSNPGPAQSSQKEATTSQSAGNKSGLRLKKSGTYPKHSARLWPEHNWYIDWNYSKSSSLFPLPATHIPRTVASSLLDYFNLRVLVHSEILWSKDETHVYGDQLFSVFIPFYGMLGLWTEKVGYHHVRDFWIYNILFGLFQALYYAYAQTMMSEVTPRGYENMFFGLFGITNRAVSHCFPHRRTLITNLK